MPEEQFQGFCENKMDAKGRVFFPAKMRHNCDSVFELTRGLEGCVQIYTMSAWEIVASKIRSLSPFKYRDTQRFFFSAAERVELDKQGRFLVPPALREHASLEEDVVIIGVGGHVELWDKAKWDAYHSSPDVESKVASQLEELDFDTDGVF